MIHSFYLVAHQKLKELQDENGLIDRKEILHCLKFQPRIQEHVREIVIREMTELGLLERVNSQKYRWIPNKYSEMINIKHESWKIAAFHKKTWWTKEDQ